MKSHFRFIEHQNLRLSLGPTKSFSFYRGRTPDEVPKKGFLLGFYPWISLGDFPRPLTPLSPRCANVKYAIHLYQLCVQFLKPGSAIPVPILVSSKGLSLPFEIKIGENAETSENKNRILDLWKN